MESGLFQEFCRLIYQRSGIFLKAGKEALVTARISKRLRALNIGTHEEYLRYLLGEPSGEEFVHFLDAIATNVTRFFRETPHFTYFRRQLETLSQQGQRRFRFWSAACSTGEEPYSIAMVAADVLGLEGPDWKVLATDLSTRVLEQAALGVFHPDRTADVPPDYRRRFFDTVREGGLESVRIKPQLRERVVFRRLNLAQPPFPMKGPIEAAFCRNVMIYFDKPVRERLIDAICRLLPRDGILFVGLSESLANVPAPLTCRGPAIYQRQ